MPQIPAIGIQDFETIRKENCVYVDKTDFIREWWESKDVVTLVTRPRRFGKTLNMSMLDYFFSLEHTGRSDLFEGLHIWEGETYRKMQGTYPVISLSFAGIKGGTWKQVRQSLFLMIGRLCTRYAYLLKSEKLLDVQKNRLKRMMELDYQMEESLAVNSFNILSECLALHHGKKPLIFLDEYDTLMQEAYVYGYWNEMVLFIQSLFNATFKTNPYLGKSILTGITRVSKESVFSDLNNLEVVTTTSDKYAAAFGFTEQEVFQILKEQGLANKMKEVKNWYDGFVFGSIRDIYNPWSILNFLSERKLGTYWANTSSNELVSKLIREGTPEIKVKMEDLLKGFPLYAVIDEQIVLNQLDKNTEAVWSLLLASGYLKILHAEWDNQIHKERYELGLTNLEVKILFESLIEEWFAKPDAYYNEFLKALLAGDVKSMNLYMNRVALATFSYFDTGRRPSEYVEPERFYHGFVLGLMVELRTSYRITSNRESGFGRYDVMLEPLELSDRDNISHTRKLPAIILEFKVHDPEEEDTLSDTVCAALRQIEEKQYDALLLEKGIDKEQIRHYGFAFEGKRVLIG